LKRTFGWWLLNLVKNQDYKIIKKIEAVGFYFFGS